MLLVRNRRGKSQLADLPANSDSADSGGVSNGDYGKVDAVTARNDSSNYQTLEGSTDVAGAETPSANYQTLDGSHRDAETPNYQTLDDVATG
jgi:hypothetical protein